MVATRVKRVVPAGTRWCPGCQQTRPLPDFTVYPHRIANYCKDCNAIKYKLSKYTMPSGTPMTLADYRAILAAQHGVCPICERGPEEAGTLAVDHDHDVEEKTGMKIVRGLLCAGCNQAYGNFGDGRECTPRRLSNAMAYYTRTTVGVK